MHLKQNTINKNQSSSGKLKYHVTFGRNKKHCYLQNSAAQIFFDGLNFMFFKSKIYKTEIKLEQ